MTEEIRQITENKVNEWKDYALKVYGWNKEQLDFFEEPMKEVSAQIAILATKKFQSQLTEKNKQIEELENKISDMEIGVNVFNSQERKIAELEAQIEKMKKCENCIHHEAETYDYRAFCYHEDTCKNHSEWQLKELAE